MQDKPTTAEIVIMASGAGAIVFSFLDWLDAGFGGGFNAWDDFFFPTYTWVGLFGVVMAVVIALEVFANVRLPDRVLGFTWPQIHVVLALYTALLVVSFLILDKSGGDMAIGFFLSLLASAGLVVGAFMLQNERPTGVRRASTGGGQSPGSPPPSSPPPSSPPPSSPPPSSPPPSSPPPDSPPPSSPPPGPPPA